MRTFPLYISSMKAVRAFRLGKRMRLHMKRSVTTTNWEEPLGLRLEESKAESLREFTFPPESSMAQCLKELRDVFDSRFAFPRASHPDRYLWDPWHVSHRNEDYASRPKKEERTSASSVEEKVDSLQEATAAARALEGNKNMKTTPMKNLPSTTQYSMLRTSALEYFADTPDLLDQFLFELSEFGRKQLGCDAYTPPWLALYTDGHEMNWHTDASHGPFAFVISLTPNDYYAPTDSHTPAFFTGGETILMKPQVLDYWRSFDSSKGLETHSLMDLIPPTPFGKLLIFDGRIPHRVSRVSGSRDPRRGRLVLTGWFSEPRVRAEGGLASGDDELLPHAQTVLDKALDQASEASRECDIGRVFGFIALRIELQPDGSVSTVTALADTLVPDPAENVNFFDSDDIGTSISEHNQDQADADLGQLSDFANAPPDRALKLLLRASLFAARFPESDEPTTVVVPCQFD